VGNTKRSANIGDIKMVWLIDLCGGSALPRRRVAFDAPFYKIEGTEGAPARFFAKID
jgi:hypothetical protein